MVLLIEAAVGAAGPPARAQVTLAVAVGSFDLGYGPSTLFPASQGTPVYSAGDQLWVRSHYNSTLVVAVSFIVSNSTYFLGTVKPETPTRLLLVNASYPQGIWALRVINSSLAPILLLVSDAASVPENLTLAGSNLNAGVLDMNFTTSSAPHLQEAQACILGSQDQSTAVVPVPASAGGGTVSLVMNGNAINASMSGAGTGNFTLQVDLDYSYAFLAPNSTSIVLLRVLLTRSDPSGFLLLQSDGRLKTGRYELRLFFEGAQGTFFATTDVLITGEGSWVWLGDCTNTEVYSNNFSIAMPLGSDPSNWPRTLWLTYAALGEEGFANISLRVNLAALTFVGTPWEVPLSSYEINAVATAGTDEIDVQNGTMFMILSSSQALVNYTVGLGGQVFFRGEAAAIEPFTTAIVPLNVSELAVTYFVKGLPHEGDIVSVSNAAGGLITAATDKNGQASFYLPAGVYNVTAAGLNGTASQLATLAFGQRLALGLGQQPSSGVGGGTFAWALGAIAAAGVAVNAIVFLSRRRKKF
jgi:hypothetical protein